MMQSIIVLQIIDYTSVRGGVSVLTNKAEITTSYLIIQKAQIEDGGIYSCENGVVDPAKVKVHVLTGKTMFLLHRKVTRYGFCYD